MAGIVNDIIDWLHGRSDWIQEAAEKLINLKKLSDEDILALVERLKKTEGQEITSNRSFLGLVVPPTSTNELRLKSIGNVQGIEILSPRIPLTFGKGNLVVVYGANGSGKSSYIRILKRACGKSHSAELIPNVFQSPPAVQQCTITYTLAGNEKNIEWPANSNSIDDLRAVDFFDSDAASLYLGGENGVSYTPSSVYLFESLAAICDQVKTILQKEQNLLVCKLPELPHQYEQTIAGKAYLTLRPNIPSNIINILTQWNAASDETLNRLNERLQTVDPAALAKKERDQMQQLSQLADRIKKTATSLSRESLENLRKIGEAAKNKRKIATDSATINAKSTKLDGIGTKTWVALWEAARSYSLIAYPGQNYPNVQNGARCVLCQQELTPEAQERLRNFDEYIPGSMETQAKAAEENYCIALANLPSVPSAEELQTKFIAAGLSNEVLLAELSTFWDKTIEAIAALKRQGDGIITTTVDFPDHLLAEIDQLTTELGIKANQDDMDASAFDRKKAMQDKLELEARRWTAQQATAIRLEIMRLKQIEDYNAWIRSANSRSISMKAGEIADKIITPAYVERFNRELMELGADHIKVELEQTRIERGKPLHQIKLKNTRVGQAPPISILSDGEKRIVAMAAFLADVAEKPYSAPFVFDDPISSLDIEFEWKVATRLTVLAKDRQVLIFTHRLSLYGAMEDAAIKNGDKWKKENLEERCIESYGGTSGNPADKAILNATTTTEANKMLIDRLREATKVGEIGGAEAYRVQAQSVCTEFRKLLERTVEDDLLNKIVKRHRRSVTTDNRLAMLANITSADCKFFDTLMTKYSCYEHSQSQEIDIPVPEEEELRTDIEKLKQWREDFKSRKVEATI